MSLDDFLTYYRDRHGPLMVELMRDKGLVSYEHFPIDASITGGRYVDSDGAAYDAVSVYSFETMGQAEECWAMPEVIADSQVFIDFDTLVALPAARRKVYPEA